MANKKKLALLTLHGMGTTEKEYYVDLRDDLISLVGKNAWKDVHFEPVYYQDLVQDPQNAYYASIKDKVDSKRLRKLFLFGISDAGSLEYSRTIPNSAYEKPKGEFSTLWDAPIRRWRHPRHPSSSSPNRSAGKSYPITFGTPSSNPDRNGAYGDTITAICRDQISNSDGCARCAF